MGNGSDGTLHSTIIEENLLDAYIYIYTETRLGLSYCADHLFSPIQIYSNKVFCDLCRFALVLD